MSDTIQSDAAGPPDGGLAESGDRVGAPVFWEPSLAFVKIAIVFTLAGSIAYEVALLLFAPGQTERMLTVLVFPLISGVSWFLCARGRIRPAILTMVCGIWAIVTVSSFFYGGANSTTIMIYPMIIIFVGWMFGVREAVATAILTTAVTLCFVLFDSWGIISHQHSTPLVLRWMIQCLVFVVSVILIAYLVRFYGDRLAEVRRLTRDLAQRSAELGASRADLYRAQAVARVGSWVYDVSSRIVHLTGEACRIFGVTEGTAGRIESFRSRVLPEDRFAVDRAWQVALQGGAHFDIEHRVQVGQEIRWVRHKSELERGADGAPRRVIGTVQDVTERRNAEEELRAQTERLRLGQMAARLIVVDWDIRNDTLTWSDSPEWLRGPVPAGGKYPPFKDQVHPDDREQFIASRAKSSATLDGQPLDYRVIRTDGETRWVHSQPVVFAGADGKAARQLIALLDITERKAVEAMQRESEARFRQLFEVESDAVFLVDAPTAKIIEVNAAAEKMYGYSRAELLDMHAPDVSAEPEVTRESIKKTWNKIVRRRHRKKDGTEFTVEIAGSNFEARGQVVHVAAIRDITQRLAAEQALRESEELYRNLIERSPEAISVHREGRFIYFNPTANRILGATPEHNLLGKLCEELVHPDFHELVLARQTVLASQGGVAPTAEMKFVRLDGTAIDVETQATQISHDGVPTIYVTWRDITARKQEAAAHAALEAQLRESRKMEALGTLAGGIAHDFNNILSAIRGSVQLARAELPAAPAAASSLDQIERSAARAIELVRQILAFSRGQKSVRTPQDMAAAVAEAVKILRAALPSTIEIHTWLQPDLPFVQTSLVAVHQLVMNLGVNAAHAMADAGRLEIEVDEVMVDAALAARVRDLKPGRSIRLTVRDFGCGMDGATMARIFDPFYSTKGPDTGTGLGLSVAYGIMKEHGAAVDIESAPGKGATFRIYFPAVEAGGHEANETPQRSVVSNRGQGERIMFVDDEEELAGLSQMLLENMGYRVKSCLSGEDALAVFKRNPEAFDAIITDTTMPGMSGLDLAEKVRALRPDFPVIVMSGYVREADSQRAAALGIGDIHWKPNTVEDLAETLRQRLVRAKS